MRKISVDLTDENYAAIDNIKSTRQMPYSTFINLLIHVACKSPDIRDELITICKSRIRELYAEMDRVGNYEFQILYNKSQQYLKILSVITDDQQLSVTTVLDEKCMKQIRIADGYLIYPSKGFIFLNESASQVYRNVCIVEVSNAKFEVPHFVYFSAEMPSKYKEADTTYIKQLCVQKWPRFQEIIDTAKEPIFAPNSFRCLNDEELRVSPQIGYFGIRAVNDPDYSDLFEPPYGIKIVRDQNKRERS